MRCANCLGKGHASRDCPQPRKGAAERLCFRCEKPGHTSSKCPERGAANSLAAVPRRVVINCLESDGFIPVHRLKRRLASRRSSEAPRVPEPTLGDFMGGVFQQLAALEKETEEADAVPSVPTSGGERPRKAAPSRGSRRPCSDALRCRGPCCPGRPETLKSASDGLHINQGAREGPHSGPQSSPTPPEASYALHISRPEARGQPETLESASHGLHINRGAHEGPHSGPQSSLAPPDASYALHISRPGPETLKSPRAETLKSGQEVDNYFSEGVEGKIAEHDRVPEFSPGPNAQEMEIQNADEDIKDMPILEDSDDEIMELPVPCESAVCMAEVWVPRAERRARAAASPQAFEAEKERIEAIFEREAVSRSSRDADSGDGEVRDHNHDHEEALNSPTNSATQGKNVRRFCSERGTSDKVTIRAEL